MTGYELNASDLELVRYMTDVLPEDRDELLLIERTHLTQAQARLANAQDDLRLAERAVLMAEARIARLEDQP